jgi:hypothetical protein
MLAKGDDVEAVLEALSKGLTAKFLHGPQQALHHAQGEQRSQLARCCRNCSAPSVSAFRRLAAVLRLAPRRRRRCRRPFIADRYGLPDP